VLVKVKPMLGRVADWREYLSTEPDSTDTEILRRHMRTGRPLGNPKFVESLEAKIGRALAPRKRGPKPRSRAN
jgi:putative transposase